MANLAIKGHATRGKEVIELLEMLGANRLGYKDTFAGFYYYIECGAICSSDEYPIYSTIFTLEEFLEKYPYKIGDKVDFIKYDDEDNVYEIVGMMWTGSTIEYTLDSFGFTCLTKDIRLHKENNMNKNFKSLNVETYLKVWDETENGLEVCVAEGYEMIEKNGQFYIVKQKTKYPKTYKECCDILEIGTLSNDVSGWKELLLISFQELLIARDAYWKIAGEQMGLDKFWEPDFTNIDEERYGIYTLANKVERDFCGIGDVNMILTFPTEEMRNIFYENFKDTIEDCKKFL